MNNSNFEVPICTYFLEGRCTFGVNCKYSHNLYLHNYYSHNLYTQQHNEFLKNYVFFDDFETSVQNDLAQNRVPMIMMKCLNYHKYRNCPNGDSCIFAHGYKHGIRLQAYEYYLRMLNGY
jgi:hypothetical protein